MGKKLNGKWALMYNKCRDCKKSDRPHVQHGYCSACWPRARYKRAKKLK